VRIDGPITFTHEGTLTREHPVLSTVNDRVEYISELMEQNVWNQDTTRRLQKELAAAWGVVPATIRSYSSEAARTRIEAVRERRGEIAKRAIQALLDVTDCEVAMPGDRAAKVTASKVLLEFAGVDRPEEDKVQRHVVASIDEATPEKAREVMRGLFGDVTPDADPDDLAERG
jgi:hypothetical protein